MANAQSSSASSATASNVLFQLSHPVIAHHPGVEAGAPLLPDMKGTVPGDGREGSSGHSKGHLQTDFFRLTDAFLTSNRPGGNIGES